MTLARGVLEEKDVTRPKFSPLAIACHDCGATCEENAPLLAWRDVGFPICKALRRFDEQNLAHRPRAISDHVWYAVGYASGRTLCLHILEARAAVIGGVDPNVLHTLVQYLS